MEFSPPCRSHPPTCSFCVMEFSPVRTVTRRRTEAGAPAAVRSHSDSEKECVQRYGKWCLMFTNLNYALSDYC
eukprot:1866924-Rhodomonas_salina.2